MGLIAPYNGPPKSKKISREEANWDLPKYVKIGDHIGVAKTFPEDYWDDENAWNNQNVWGS